MLSVFYWAAFWNHRRNLRSSRFVHLFDKLLSTFLWCCPLGNWKFWPVWLMQPAVKVEVLTLSGWWRQREKSRSASDSGAFLCRVCMCCVPAQVLFLCSGFLPWSQNMKVRWSVNCPQCVCHFSGVLGRLNAYQANSSLVQKNKIKMHSDHNSCMSFLQLRERKLNAET